MVSHQILITFVTASALGVFLMLTAHRFKISAIVLLLLGGILVGPEFLGLVQPDVLGMGLNAIISLSVGLILFEGGLTLDVNGYKQVSREIWGVLTKGVIVTWGISTIALRWLFDFDWVFCLLAASLIIVTGPTVVGPLLQRIRVKKKLHQILYWEGVLIDPIGVFIALLCYEWILSAGTPEAYMNFFSRILVGTVLGVLFGLLIFIILRAKLVPDEKVNFFILTSAMLNFMIADSLVTESGLLSVTLAGFLLGYKRPPQLSRIVSYKVELKDFLIGLLFILLAANLTLSNFLNYGWGLMVIVAIVMFVVRPINIFLSTWNSQLSIKEKLFLSWIAPRGIVAASMASLFAFNLQKRGFADAYFLETFAYAVIVGTVVFQGFSAGLVGKILGVLQPKPEDWVIIGAHKLARSVAHFIQEQGHSVVLLDTNPREVQLAKREGLTAISDNAMSIELQSHVELFEIGNVLAITENQDLNHLVCQRWKKELGKVNLYYWESEQPRNLQQQEGLLVGTAIWTWLDIQTILSQSLAYKQLITCTSTRKIEEQSTASQSLMVFHNQQLLPFLPASKKGEAVFLSYESIYSKQVGPTKKEWIIFSQESTLEELYNQMLGTLKVDFPELDQPELVRELISRERQFSSLLGHGIALPHLHTQGVEESILSIAKVDPPIPCKQTGLNIELVFLVLSPEGDPAKHLKQISKIAKFIMKKPNREAFMKVTEAQGLYQVIEEGDQSFLQAGS